MLRWIFLVLSFLAMQVFAAENDKKINVLGLSNFVVASYDEAFNKGVKLSLVNDDDNAYPRHIDFYFNQVKFDFDVVFADSSRVKIPYEFPVGTESTDAGIQDKLTNSYIIGQYDFDGDGVSEIIFGVIDQVDSNVAVNIYTYTAPLHKKNQNRLKNWDQMAQLVATAVLGDVDIKFDKASITIPRHLRGFFYEYTWVKDRFIDTGEH